MTAPRPGNSPPAIVLAAGRGERLQSGVPKPLTEVSGRSLLRRVFETCSQAGVGHIVLALGHEGDLIEAHARELGSHLGLRVEAAHATDWQLGNGVSARTAAEHLAADRYFLLMGDHIVEAALLRALLDAPPTPGGVALAVDLDPDGVHDIEDATKVQVEKGHFRRIGKDLTVWNAVDTGAFLCTDGLTRALASAQAQGGHQLSDGVRTLAEADLARAVDVTGRAWIDVDTLEALHEAERRLSQARVVAP